jgi:hypothetical protein
LRKCSFIKKKSKNFSNITPWIFKEREKKTGKKEIRWRERDHISEEERKRKKKINEEETSKKMNRFFGKAWLSNVPPNSILMVLFFFFNPTLYFYNYTLKLLLVVNRKNMGNMSKHISVLEFEAQ